MSQSAIKIYVVMGENSFFKSKEPLKAFYSQSEAEEWSRKILEEKKKVKYQIALNERIDEVEVEEIELV